MKKKRILIIGDSIDRATGYATVVKNIVANLDDSFVVAQLGLASIPIDPNNTLIPIHHYSTLKDHSKCCGRGPLVELFKPETKSIEYLTPTLNVETHEKKGFCPRGVNIMADVFGQDSAFYTIQHFKPDIVVGVNDIWGIYHINILRNRQNFIYVPYLAVDSECFPVRINAQKPGFPPVDTMQFVSNSDKVVVFTDWARKTVNKTLEIAYKKKADNIEVIPHGVDRDVFFQLDNKDELREKFFGIKPEDNTFLLGSVNRNQPRKRLDAIIQTLRILIDKYEKPSKKFLLHFHCALNDNLGNDLIWLATYYGVADRCIFDKKLKPGLGCTTEVLNEIINSYDAHMVLTNSEGWGLSILETMSCGVPNVITDYSAHGDWAKDAGLKVKIAARIHEPKTDHIKGIADINHAAKQVSLLYNSTKMHKKYSKKSLDLASKLEWKKVCEQWNTLFNGLDLSKLKDNRYELLTIDADDIKSIPDDPTKEPFELIEI